MELYDFPFLVSFRVLVPLTEIPQHAIREHLAQDIEELLAQLQSGQVAPIIATQHSPHAQVANIITQIYETATPGYP